MACIAAMIIVLYRASFIAFAARYGF